MYIRRASIQDLDSIKSLLSQVLMVHHEARPDLFKANCRKYTDDELKSLIADDNKPIFVAVDEKDEVIAYAFCVIIKHTNDNILTDISSIYIDDLCVDAKSRGRHVGQELFEHVKRFAKEIGCYNVTLNVWEGNDDAKAFYEAMGLRPQKYGMEFIL